MMSETLRLPSHAMAYAICPSCDLADASSYCKGRSDRAAIEPTGKTERPVGVLCYLSFNARSNSGQGQMCQDCLQNFELYSGGIWG